MHNQEASFFEAAIPEPYTILGLRLRPLSLGHLILLNRVGSPFVTEENKVSLGDLALAVLICSLSFEDGLRMLEDPEIEMKMYKWGRRLTGQSGLFGWLPWRYKQIDMAGKIRLFSDYIASGMKCPGYFSDQSKSKPIEAPSYQIVKVALMSKTTLTESDIYDRPWSMCMWDFLTLRAIEGQITFIDNEWVREAQRQATELHNRMTKEQTNGS